ncbi:MAG: NUDIX hydrolase [Proteobacteria bacterium]|nr:NUDIX hydrolase [Pseudomonadota bacterium]
MINYCQYCGASVVHKIPKNDDHERAICTSCKAIHYQNPKIITGVIIEHKGQILLAKRAIEPRYGTWTIPAGFMELNETVQLGAARECYEETEARLKNIELFGVYNTTINSQVYTIFRAQLASAHFQATVESLEVKLFNPQDIPWDNLAFPCVVSALKRFIVEMQTGYTVAVVDIHADFAGSQSAGYFDS